MLKVRVIWCKKVDALLFIREFLASSAVWLSYHVEAENYASKCSCWKPDSETDQFPVSVRNIRQVAEHQEGHHSLWSGLLLALIFKRLTPQVIRSKFVDDLLGMLPKEISLLTITSLCWLTKPEQKKVLVQGDVLC